MKRIIRNISSCVLLALVMGACEEDAALVSPINWLVWKSAVSRMTPKDEGTEAALALLATRKPDRKSTRLNSSH